MVSLLFLYTPSITSVKFNNTTEYHSQIIGYFCLVAAIVLPAIFIFYMFAKFDGKLDLRSIIGDNLLNNLKEEPLTSSGFRIVYVLRRMGICLIGIFLKQF